jgi:DNA-binding winged helix-turn-helix (wHTH) protein
MLVNSLRNGFQGRRKQIFLAGIILSSAVFSWIALAPDSSELMSKRINIAMRAIGHNLLLGAQDFTSPVPPVVEKSPGVLGIKFENELFFQTDSLIKIVQGHLGQAGFSDYAVTVHPCNAPYIIYGFESSRSGNAVIPCRGRQHPKACYTIEVAFAELPGGKVAYGPTALIITAVLTAFGLIWFGANTSRQKSTLQQTPGSPSQSECDSIVLGKFVFDMTRQTLRIGDEAISLTDKECKILTILNQNIGSLTSRDQLVQEVWTDEGVITGRSLDMFISKLRKKLGRDGDIRITAIHGKGYRLDIVNDAALGDSANF